MDRRATAASKHCKPSFNSGTVAVMTSALVISWSFYPSDPRSNYIIPLDEPTHTPT
jgi:hypothetical protein